MNHGICTNVCSAWNIKDSHANKIEWLWRNYFLKCSRWICWKCLLAQAAAQVSSNKCSDLHASVPSLKIIFNNRNRWWSWLWIWIERIEICFFRFRFICVEVSFFFKFYNSANQYSWFIFMWTVIAPHIHSPLPTSVTHHFECCCCCMHWTNKIVISRVQGYRFVVCSLGCELWLCIVSELIFVCVCVCAARECEWGSGHWHVCFVLLNCWLLPAIFFVLFLE